MMRKTCINSQAIPGAALHLLQSPHYPCTHTRPPYDVGCAEVKEELVPMGGNDGRSASGRGDISFNGADASTSKRLNMVKLLASQPASALTVATIERD